MKRAVLLGFLLLTSCAAPPEGPAPAASYPPAVILMIGDGAGVAYWSAAKLTANAPLAIEAFPVLGLVDTRSADDRITDSAAGGTAFASGIRTNNAMVGVAPDSTPVQTVLELAESRDWATGLVATSSLTHATPAAFAAHVPSRNMHHEIARQMAGQGIDVMLGGGRMYFAPEGGADGSLERLTRDATYVDDARQFLALDPDTVQALVGLFAENHPGSAADRSPSLPEMTDVALRVLEKDPDGFFLMVESSQIDWLGHENALLPDVLAEVNDFDQAVRAALRFHERRPNTLIIVVADHETGGLAVHPDRSGEFGAHYTTDRHTGELVPLFAVGPGAEQFGGIKENAEVGQLLLEIVGAAGADRPLTGVLTEDGAR
ncbi:MAG: alkaline phosphatase [Gemmatimonadota bacterium]